MRIKSPGLSETVGHLNGWARGARISTRLYPSILFGILILFTASAILAPWVAPYDPNTISLQDRLLPPAWLEGGSHRYLLGTDNLGRDVLSRILFGGRVSLAVGFIAVFLAGVLGVTLGLLAGYFGGFIDALIMRLTDAANSVPIILVALLFVITLGASFTNLVVALAVLLWARYPRVIRSEVLSLRTREFVVLARVGGASHARILLRHILPNLGHTVLVLLTLQLGVAVITEATLSFLGAGVPPTLPAWGNMMAVGRDYVVTAWWISLFPGIAILLTVLAFNLAGDWLRDHLDPEHGQD
jgi:peptide/nickel transport system permease protein